MSSGNGGKFAVDMKKWTFKTAEELTAITQQSIYDVAFKAVIDTPVDVGHLRGSWQPTFGEPSTEGLGEADKSGGNTLSKIALAILNIPSAPGPFYLTNNAAYARRMEYGFVGPDSLGRVYNQPGRFFVTNAVKSWDKIVTNNLKRLRSYNV